MQNSTRLTLFTRPHCGLCDSAKLVLQSLSKKKYFQLKQVDVMDPVNARWKLIYELDTPVVRDPEVFCLKKMHKADHLQLHVQPMSGATAQPDLAADARKLMHRFTGAQVEQVIDEVEGHYWRFS